jgi:hypothetical protein
VPPAGRLEVAQLAGARLGPVLRLAVPADVEVAVGGRGDAEGPAGVGLLGVELEAQRVVAVATEADVGQPRPGVAGVDAEGQVVERRPEPVGAEDPGRRAASRRSRAPTAAPRRRR